MITAEEKGLASSAKKQALGRVLKLVRIMVSLGIMIWLVSMIDCSAAFEAVQSTRSMTLSVAIGLVLLAHLFSAFRLHLLLAWQKAGISFRKTLEMTFAGLFAGNFLPGTIGGDAFKIWGLIQAGTSKHLVTATVVLDRIISLIAMLFLLPAAFFAPRLLSPKEMLGVGLIFFLGLFSAILFLTLAYFFGVRQGREGVEKHQGLLSWVRRSGYRFHLQLVFLKAHPLATISALVLSWLFFLAAILAMWALAKDLGIRVSYLEMTGALSIAYFVSLIPLSLNGLGIQEGALILLLAHVGATSPQSLALAGIARLLHWVSSLIGAGSFIKLVNKGK